MKCFVPNVAGLSHAVDAFQELPDPVFLSRNFKTSRLLHVHSLVQGQNTVKESGFDVELLDICYDLALKSGRFKGYWSTDIPKTELRDVRLQFLVATTDLDDEEMPKPAGKGPNDEEEVKEVVFPRYD